MNLTTKGGYSMPSEMATIEKKWIKNEWWSEEVEKLKTWTLLARMEDGSVIVKKSLVSPQKVKPKVTIWTVETVADFIFLGSKITADGDCSHEIKRRLLRERKVMINLDSTNRWRDTPCSQVGRVNIVKKFKDKENKKQRCYFVRKCSSSQGYGFSSGHVWMWELDCEESWVQNCDVGEDSWESLELQRDQPVHAKGDQSWVFIGRTDVEAETPILWTPDAKSWPIWKDPDAGKDWGQEEEMTEDEMVGWHHQLNGDEFG